MTNTTVSLPQITSRAEQRVMKLVSLNVGYPRTVTWHGIDVTTGIFKQPVQGRVRLRKLNLDGDRQADLTVHGGEFKAVYCYSISHYDYWRGELGRDHETAIAQQAGKPANGGHRSPSPWA